MIRRATESDLPGVLAIERTSFNLPHWSEADFRSALDPTPNFLTRVLLVAETNGECQGIAVASALTGLFPVEVEIQNLAVAGNHRRRGVARDLMHGLLAWAAEQQAAVIRLEVRVSNAAAIHLYEEFGFATTGKRGAYYHNPTEDALLMEMCPR